MFNSVRNVELRDTAQARKLAHAIVFQELGWTTFPAREEVVKEIPYHPPMQPGASELQSTVQKYRNNSRNIYCSVST